MMSTFPRAGEIFCNRYRLDEVLGTGGFGTVFKAWQLDARRTVALKILQTEPATDDSFKKRFVKEARALSNLQHAGIVTVYHVGVSDEGMPYIAMEYIRGKSVRQILTREGRLPVLRAIGIARQAAEALAYVHEHGIVHRDLKPENIILVEEPEADTVKLIDFGLARVLGEQKVTGTGLLVGSPKYMSPEQCQGQPVDGRADVYALTVCFYEMITGAEPFQADNPIALVYKHIHEAIPAIQPCQVDRFHNGINELVAAATAKDPADRYKGMTEFACALTELQYCLEENRAKFGKGEKCFADKDAEDGKLKHSLLRRTALYLTSGLVCSALVVVFCSHLFRHSEAEVQVKKAKTPSLALPRTAAALEQLATNCIIQGRHSELYIIMRNWEKKYMNSELVATDAKFFVLSFMASHKLRDGRIDEANRYLNLLDKIDSSAVAQLFTANARADIHQQVRQPEKAIAVIESVLHRLPLESPSERTADALCQCLTTEGDCYFDIGNPAKAAEFYLKALDLRRKISENLDQGQNLIRFKAIVALKKLGRSADSSIITSDALKAAEKFYESRYISRHSKYSTVAKLVDGGREAAEGAHPIQEQEISAVRAAAAAEVFAELSTLFLERGCLKDFCDCSNLSIKNYIKSGQTGKACSLLDLQILRADSHEAAAQTARQNLNEISPDDFAGRIKLLLILTEIYTYRLARPDLAEKYGRQACKLIEEQLQRNPDLLLEKSGREAGKLWRCMEDNRKVPLDDLSRNCDALINRCGGRDCEALRSLYSFKVGHLQTSARLADALALCDDRIKFFSAAKPGFPEQESIWLREKAEIYLHMHRFNEALRDYRQSYKVIEPIQSDELKGLKKEILFSLASTAAEHGDHQEALARFGEMESLIGTEASKGSAFLVRDDCNRLLVFAVFCMKQGDYARAAQSFDRAEKGTVLRCGEESPEVIEITFCRGDLLKRQHKNNEAIAAFKKVVSLCLKHHVTAPVYSQSLSLLASLTNKSP
jgi:tetratricopeptide (TPR) repeat protein/predicted Ser/Thr protein kinase